MTEKTFQRVQDCTVSCNKLESCIILQCFVHCESNILKEKKKKAYLKKVWGNECLQGTKYLLWVWNGLNADSPYSEHLSVIVVFAIRTAVLSLQGCLLEHKMLQPFYTERKKKKKGNFEISEAVCGELRETQEVTHGTQEKVERFEGKCSVGGFWGPNGSKWNAKQNDEYEKLVQWMVSQHLMSNGMGVSACFLRRHRCLR